MTLIPTLLKRRPKAVFSTAAGEIAPTRSQISWPAVTMAVALMISSHHGYTADQDSTMEPDADMAEDLKSLAPDAIIEQRTVPNIRMDVPHEVMDVAYGEFLFDFFQNREFEAILKALIAKHKNALPNHDQQVDVLLGPMYLKYGMLEEAERIFTELLASAVDANKQHQIWFMLAEIHYKKSNFQKSLNILKTHIDYPEPKLADQIELLAALNYLTMGEMDKALHHLKNVQNAGELGIYALYNTATAYARLEQHEEAERYFKLVMKSIKRDRLPKELKERAALALGKYYLENERWADAKASFETVRLQGPAANTALLGLGWSYLNNEDPMGALAPWLELQKRHNADPAVQEAHLNVPYIFEQLGALQSALDGYRKADEHFQAAHGEMEATKSQINDSLWIDSLTPAESFSHNPMDPIPPFSPPNVDSSHYLYKFFASHPFNEQYRSYRNLQSVIQNLQDWRERLPIYQEMIAANLDHLKALAPYATDVLINAKKTQAEVRSQLAGVASQLDFALDNDDNTATADATQIKLLDRIKRLESKIAELEPTIENQLLRDRFRVVKGLLNWDLNDTAIERRWELVKDRVFIENQLSELEANFIAVDQAVKDRRTRFDGFDERISALDARLTELESTARSQMKLHRAALRSTALGILEIHQSHLNELRANAIFAIARLQDMAYVQGKEDVNESDKIELPDTKVRSRDQGKGSLFDIPLKSLFDFDDGA